MGVCIKILPCNEISLNNYVIINIFRRTLFRVYLCIEIHLRCPRVFGPLCSLLPINQGVYGEQSGPKPWLSKDAYNHKLHSLYHKCILVPFVSIKLRGQKYHKGHACLSFNVTQVLYSFHKTDEQRTKWDQVSMDLTMISWFNVLTFYQFHSCAISLNSVFIPSPYKWSILFWTSLYTICFLNTCLNSGQNPG